MKWRVARWFGPGVNPSTDVAYRVESAELLSQHDAVALRDLLNAASEEERDWERGPDAASSVPQFSPDVLEE